MPNLTFNILTFKHPEKNLTLYFSDQEGIAFNRTHHNIVPKEVSKHFGEQEHYYTAFNQADDTLLKVIVPSKHLSASLAKRYYNFLIYDHFKNLGALVKPNFVNDIEIWIPNTQEKSQEFNFYEKFALRVQIAKLSPFPELLISYEGKSKVLKKNVASIMSEVSPTSINWVIYGNNLYKNSELPDEVSRDLDNAFPVLNNALKSELGYPTPAPDRTNKYKRFSDRVNRFYTKFLKTDAFRKIIPLDERDFLPVKKANISSVSDQSNLLAFGNKKLSKVPMQGMKNFGPLEISPYNNIHFFFIIHEDDEESGKLLHEYLKGDIRGFGGLYNFAKTKYYPQKDLSIKFKNRENPVPEIEQALNNTAFDDGIRYIAIYVSPHSKTTTDKDQREVYYKVKETLLKRRITSQAIDASKVNSNGYRYSLPNIAIAILAKLDGKPWRLDTAIKNELIVGVGAFRNSDTDIQYIGSAFSFMNNGNFDRFECFQENQTTELAGSILRAIKEYAAINNAVERLIIHFYKNMSQRELQPIEDGLRELELDIPIYIVSINKTESQDIVAFDNDWSELMPLSGTFINLGKGKYLLFNNTRYYGEVHKSHEGYPFPIKISIFCTDSEKEKDSRVIKELIDQVYQFSRMYWKSVSQQNLPVTIKYPEMVAEIFPHFDGNEIPEFGKSNLWFL
ncbi:MAG: Piwi domain-containing protein [Cyclobacteriaceae bacterium]